MTDQIVPELTDRQRLVPLKQTGHILNLKPYEKLLAVNTETPGTIVVSIKCVDMTERAHGFQINKTGVRMFAYQQQPDGTWTVQKFTAWDEEPDVVFCRTLGKSVDIFLHRDRVSWALLCHRPGTDRAPLDSADRTFEHRELSPDSMIRHWEK